MSVANESFTHPETISSVLEDFCFVSPFTRKKKLIFN